MKKTPKSKRGGKRAGAGRKPVESKMKTRSIVLDPAASAELDRLRGNETPGRFITREMGLLGQS